MLLIDALGDAVFSESELHRIQDDPELLQRLERGYLPTISAPDWDYALSMTENRTAINSGWWTVMVAGTSGQFGLTAPQDGFGADLVALFTGPAANVQMLVYDPGLGALRGSPAVPVIIAFCYRPGRSGHRPPQVSSAMAMNASALWKPLARAMRASSWVLIASARPFDRVVDYT